MMHQETLSVDGVIDKFVRNFGLLDKWDLRKAKNISSTINLMFSPNINCDESYIKNRIKKILSYKEKLKQLQCIPLIEQRSPQWYAMRKEIITASDFAQALGEGKFGTQKQLYQKKCGYEEEKFNSSLPPLKWGTMFENVAAGIYKKRFQCELYEFGLLRHPTVDFFGASPDGITDFGVMVEIKCPFKRKITGEVPTQYYYQIQGQLDVCGLDECDYLECEFVTYDTLENALQSENRPQMEWGIILEFEDQDRSSSYKYSDITMFEDLHKLDSWIATTTQVTTQEKQTFVRAHYWALNTLNVVRIYRNNAFVSEKLASLKEVWDKIKTYQDDKELYIKEVGSKESSSKRQQSVTLSGYSFIH